ncbi:antileukoproteinase-like [Pleurodeles waltl]|uniref:antileukoproteinase-like n=1 Tax=Pleurodeles waltl TaxID=8319 RepID=UPI003709B593
MVFRARLLALSLLGLSLAVSCVMGQNWIKEKQGVCPVQCKYDYECPGCQKCCFDCGFKCVDPVDNEPKKGMCPMAATFCPQRDPDKCCVDNDCPKSQRCCLIRCGKMCVDPLKG